MARLINRRAQENAVADELRGRGWTCYPPNREPGVLLGMDGALLCVPRTLEVDETNDGWTARAEVRRSSPAVATRFGRLVRVYLVTAVRHGYGHLTEVTWDPDDVRTAYLKITGDGRMVEHGA